MRLPSIVTLATALLGGGMALAQTPRPPPSPVPSPGVVLGELHVVNVLEVELGNLAQANAGQVEVQKFGQQMVKAHTRMDARGNEYARRHQLTVTPPPNDPEHQIQDDAHAALKERLRTLKGAEFDKAYLEAMADDHGKVLDKLTSWEAQTQDKDLRQFIGQASKEVAGHKQQADALLARLGRSASR